MSDLESPLRKELVEILGQHFQCFEEVDVTSVIAGHRIRADVVAVPRCKEFDSVTIAFEVKSPTAKWELKNWVSALKQAHDYVDGMVVGSSMFSRFGSRRINASFVFPFPFLGTISGPHAEKRGFLRDWDVEPLRGALDLAALLRVGAARLVSERTHFAELRFGPNRIWSGKSGYSQHANNTLLGRRRIGSQMK